MRLSRTCSLLACALLWTAALPASASGGDSYQTNRFASEFQPANAELFASGNLGVVPGSYWRVYHYLAYQAARGRALTSQQVAALDLKTWHVSNSSEWAGVDPEKNNSETWVAARAPYAAQAGLPAVLPMDPHAETEDNETYLNCHSDAFRQAGVTMAARARLGAGGKPDAWFKLWLQGQDAVFSNCEERHHGPAANSPKRVVKLPRALPANAPDWLKDDHAYQSAAANFYARNFDLARTQFQEIARQPKSPWQALAPYLAARTLIRKAVLEFPLREQEPAAPARIAALAQARQELDALAPASVPARQMGSLVAARLNPAERLAALARALDKEPFGPDTPHMVSDYLLLMDKLLDTAPNSIVTAREPMTLWIASMQSGPVVRDLSQNQVKQLLEQRAGALDAVRKSWIKQPDPLWMAPLLTMAGANELSAAERKAAAAVPPTHPLYQTVQYHLARLALAEQHGERADQDLDRLLSAYGKQMSVATTNRFLALKMASAGTVDEFLKAAPRRPDPVERGEAIDAPEDHASGTDADFGTAVWRHLPMSELKVLLKHPLLPPGWKPMLQETIFTRAIIFNDEDTALGLLDAVASTRKSTAHLYQRYRKAASGAGRKLAGALILVNTPELQPSVVNQDDKARFWGCGTHEQPPLAAHMPVPAPRFLGAQRTAQAAREQETLLRLPLRTEFLAPVLLEWARIKPVDEEAPKALHFLVASTRMECPGGTAVPEEKQLRARYSREAYELTHKLYPASKWTKATKYYY
ncbi:hypothetical protein [Massilia pseudoviolaceinigra]|uniref:hypothetical protein n=1 Tax=Massilia pseudoviolaceinigra TaxID=3057165 RepID=UPI002796B876|nr:hypothetical protein [Massilia sp. CCM 9206]MDQ1920294.1 hypothetical protein [Massilia sp. CCM 9206]